MKKISAIRAFLVLLTITTGSIFLTSCSGSTAAGTLVSAPTEFYSDGCDGYIFDARVSGNVAILGIKNGENPVGSLTFTTDGNLSQQTPLVTDNDPPAKSFMKGSDKVCFQFGLEDKSTDACLSSMFETGAFCIAVKEEGG